MRHPKLREWEKRLRGVFESIDDALEEKYGEMYPLHPARAEHGSTGNRRHDGLFRAGSVFSAGFGSEHGAGYIVKVEMITLSDVPAAVRSEIEAHVALLLEESLPQAFPKADLRVERDGPVYKIVGDLSLGEV